MKTPYDFAIIYSLLVVVTSCSSMPKSTESLQFTSTPVTAQTIQPTQIVMPSDLAFSTPLVQILSQSGLNIVSVKSSTYVAMFQSTDKAAWIKTNEGIIEAVFFTNSAEVQQIHISEQINQAEGRYLYTIQAPAPTLLHDQTIDAAYPLYFTIKNDLLLSTSSAELDKTLKHIFSGQ